MKGEYDLVICSPLTRARQTLEYANIKYNQLLICEEARELKSTKCDFFSHEEMKLETQKEMAIRVKQFKNFIKEQAKTYDSILVVGHCISFVFLNLTDIDGIINGKASVDGIRLVNCQLQKITV